MMKSLFRSVVAAIVVVAATLNTLQAQDVNSYFMPNAISRLDHNAAFTLGRGYVNIPLVGDISIGTAGNIALGDLFYPVDGSLTLLTSGSVSTSQALGGINKGNNFSSAYFDTSILSFGSYTKRDLFWSFDLSLKGSVEMNFPYELIEFLKCAPDQTTINDINLYAESYAEVAFGLSAPIGKRLRVGGRVKALIGLASAEMAINSLSITANEAEWNATGDGYMNINLSGVSGTDGSGTLDLDDLTFDSPNSISGLGFGVDLGATYDLLKNLQLSASINNLGFMRWRADNNLHATLATNFNFNGINVEVGDDVNSEEALFDLDEILLFEEQESVSQTKRLQAEMNLGAQYFLWDRRVSVGAFYTTYFMHTATQHRITLGGSISPLRWLSLSAAYSYCNASSLNLAINIATSFLNIYLSSNLLTTELTPQYIPVNQPSADITLGLAISLAKREKKSGKK